MINEIDLCYCYFFDLIFLSDKVNNCVMMGKGLYSFMFFSAQAGSIGNEARSKKSEESRFFKGMDLTVFSRILAILRLS